MNIIVDELPKTCGRCLFISCINSSHNTCILLKKVVLTRAMYNTKLDDCPLKELSTTNI